MSVALDTGSTDTWVKFESYDPANSSTTNATAVPLVSMYADGSAAMGKYFTDDMMLGSTKIKDQWIGVAYVSTTTSGSGILGVAPPLPKSSHEPPTIIEALKSQGITKSAAFSLNLRNVKEPTGSVIFGGIDPKKYKCSLEKLDLVPTQDGTSTYYQYKVNLTGISQTVLGDPSTKRYSVANSTYNLQELPVLLDCGSALTCLPYDLFKAIGSDYPGAQFIASPKNPNNGLYAVPCAIPKGSIEFTFGPKAIRVPYSEFVRRVPREELCFLGMMVADDGNVILSDTFFTSTYVVFDVDNKQVWLDEADDCGSDIMAIGAGPNGVPRIDGCACSAAN